MNEHMPWTDVVGCSSEHVISDGADKIAAVGKYINCESDAGIE